MQPTVIIAAIVVAAVVAGAVLLMPRVRAHVRELELRRRRAEVSAAHREEAEKLHRRADGPAQRARIAAQDARRKRDEAWQHHERAELHARPVPAPRRP